MAVVFVVPVLFWLNVYNGLSFGQIILEYKPMRPFYAGATGGNYIGHKIPPGKPWPAKPEDYPNFSVTTNNPLLTNSIKKTTMLKPPGSNGTYEEVSLPPKLQLTSKIPCVGGFIQQPALPGNTLPTTTNNNNLSILSKIPLLPEVLKITTISKIVVCITSKPNVTFGEVTSVTSLPVPKNPPFFGSTGGGLIPQSLESGKPRPSKQEDSESFNVTSMNSSLTSEIKNTSSFVTGVNSSNSVTVLVPIQLAEPQNINFYTTLSKIPEGIDISQNEGILPQKLPGINTPPVYEEVTVVPQLLKPNRPPHFGETGGNYIPQSEKPGTPWPSKPTDYENINETGNQFVIDKIEETTISKIPEDIDITQNNSFHEGILPQKLPGINTAPIYEEVIVVPQLPKPNKPPYFGETGGNYIPQSVKPGTPWPSKPTDYKNINETGKPFVIDKIEETTISKIPEDINIKQNDSFNEGILPQKLPGSNTPPFYEEVTVVPQLPKPNRPPYFGETGGNYIPQSVKPETPWPSKPTDYENINETGNQFVIDKIEETTISKIPEDIDIKQNNSFHEGILPQKLPGINTPPFYEEVIVVPQLPKPNRPPYFGETGGNYIPQSVKPGTPWPSKPTDYENINGTGKPFIINTIEETTILKIPEDINIKQNDSFHEGILPQKLPGINTPPFYEEVTVVPQLPKPNRPPYFGETGGNYIPQSVKPGTPWPSKPTDYENINETGNQFVIDKIEETTISKIPEDIDIKQNNSFHEGILPQKLPGINTPPFYEEVIVVPQLPKPNRPPYFGETGGNYIPQSVKPGTPWPSKPTDYENINGTGKPFIINTIEETTILKIPEDINIKQNDSFHEGILPQKLPGINTPPFYEEVTVVPQLPKPNRPPYFGETGGNYIPQRVKPGTPWPSKPTDYENINEAGNQFVIDKIEETTISKIPEDIDIKQNNSFHEGILPQKLPGINTPPFYEEVIIVPQLPKPNRPPYFGETGGNYIPQSVKPGTPWPSKPTDYENINGTGKPFIINTIEETTILKIPEDINIKQNDSFHEGILPQKLPGINTPPFYEEVTVVPQLPKPNRPPYFGETGGNYIPQRVKPGTPWPSKPTDYENINETGNQFVIDKIEETTILKIPEDIDIKQNDSFHEGILPQKLPGINTPPFYEEVIVVPQLPKPNRPPYFGETGGNYIPQSVKPGTPWPSKPTDYQNINETGKPLVIDKIEETTISKIPEDIGIKQNDSFHEDISPPKLPGISTPPFYEEVIVVPQLPKPNRPPYFGETGGNYIPQSVKPGTPWASKPAEDEIINGTGKPFIIDTTEETTISKISEDIDIKQNDSFYDDETGKPLVIDKIEETTISKIPEDIGVKQNDSFHEDILPQILPANNKPAFYKEGNAVPQLPKPNKPPYSGETEGNYIPQSVKPGTSWTAKPPNYENINWLKKPSIINTVNEITISKILEDNIINSSKHLPASNEEVLKLTNKSPCFEKTGGSILPQKAKPRTTKPEDYDTTETPVVVVTKSETSTTK